MFASKTVFVLGAGASAEVGLPIGSVLAELIAKKMEVEWNGLTSVVGGDPQLFMNALSMLEGNFADWLAAAQRLKNGLPTSRSIDEYLDLHRRDQAMVRLGKAAIVKTILERERLSQLYFDRKRSEACFSFSTIAETWFSKLGSMLWHPDRDKVFENVSFVSFNYDRSLELFLFYALCARYALGEDEARRLLCGARIFHPYGTVGQIPELGGTISYGKDDFIEFARSPERIRLYSEERRDTADLADMRAEILNAKTLVFLGFAYHQQNMSLLVHQGASLNQKNVFGTAFGVSDPDLNIVMGRVRTLFGDSAWSAMGSMRALQIHNELRCAGLLSEYALTLPEL